MDNNINLDWFNEKVESLEHNNGLYKFVCFFLGKKRLSYKELYIILCRLNENKLKENTKSIVMDNIIKLYYFNNNKMPNISNE